MKAGFEDREMNVQMPDFAADSLQSFTSPASFWVPDLVVDSGWVEHAPFGFWIVEALRPKAIVELGVHNGFSYFVFCQAVKRLRLQTRCFAIDTFEGDEHAGFYGKDVYERVARRNRRYDGFSRLIPSTFDEACGQFADGSIDILHIDGCHTQEAVRRDFETWLPKLSDQGVVLFHDTAERGQGFGVCLLWDELRTRYPHFEFTHGHGLGIIGVGKNIPPKVQRLFAASSSAPSAQAIRAAYERLGGAVENLQPATIQVKAIHRKTGLAKTRPNAIVMRRFAIDQKGRHDVVEMRRVDVPKFDFAQVR